MIRLEMPKNRSKSVKNGHWLHFQAFNHRLADVLWLTWIVQLILIVAILCTKIFTHLNIKYGLNKVKIESEWGNTDLLYNCAFFASFFWSQTHNTESHFLVHLFIHPSVQRVIVLSNFVTGRGKTLRHTENKTEYTYYILNPCLKR